MYSVDNGFILSHGTIQVKAYGELYHGHCYGPVVYISPENPVSLRKKVFVQSFLHRTLTSGKISGERESFSWMILNESFTWW